MSRNIFGSTTQTATFSGSSQVLGSSRTTQSTTIPSRTTLSNQRNRTENDILYAILTSNLQEVRRLVNSTNSNDVIDSVNNYTALHHAVRIRNNDKIIEYLLSVGANPFLKQNECKDAIDLSIEANYRYLIDKLLKEKENELDKIYSKFDDVNYQFKNLERKNKELIEENEYMKKSQSQYVEKIEQLKTENVGLKRKYDESEKAFANLLKKTKK